MSSESVKAEVRRYRPYIAALVALLLVAVARPPMASRSDVEATAQPPAASAGAEPQDSTGPAPTLGTDAAPATGAIGPVFPPSPSGPGPLEAPDGPGAGDVPPDDLAFLIPELPSELDPLLSIASPAATEVCTVGGLAQALAALVAGLGNLSDIAEAFFGFPLPPIVIPDEVVELVTIAMQVCGVFPVPPTASQCELDDTLLNALFSEDLELEGITAIFKPLLVAALVDSVYSVEYLTALAFPTPALILAPLLAGALDCSTEETGFGPGQ